MAQRAAIVTGGSSGIGLGIARVLGEEGYALTVAARRPEKLEEAVAGLRADGFEVNSVSGNLGDEAVVQEVVRSHRERYGRLDVLIQQRRHRRRRARRRADDQEGRPTAQHQPALTDPLLPRVRRAAARRGRRAPLRARGQHVVHLGQVRRGLAVGLQRDQGGGRRLHAGHAQGARVRGHQVDRAVPRLRRHAETDFVKEQISPEDMIQVSDVAETVRVLLRMSPGCIVPEVQFLRPGDAL